MKQLNWYQIFGQTHTIPDGSTVTPTDDVQILLNCANIWDKAYTTIADLLSDTTSLLAVIVDNNAINYLVRSTTFASSVTADATAMTDIGLNNYCANTLLANSTWLTAICNSVYFESVLNVKVPAMTSNSTPEGLAFASAIRDSNFDAWKAFDKTGSEWQCMNVDPPQYVGYKFPTSQRIYKATMQMWGSRIDTFKIQSSKDTGTWVDRTNSISLTTSATTYSYIMSQNIDDYMYHRVYFTAFRDTNNVKLCDIRELQLYGREDV